MNTSRTDNDLIQAALAGDLDAMGDLLTRHFQNILARVAAIVRNPEERKDVLQKTFIAAHRKLAQLRDPERFSAWVCRVADNTARRHMTRATRQCQFLDRLLEDGVTVEPGGSETKREEEHRRIALLRAAFVRLTPVQRKVLMHSHVHNHSRRETAQQLTISLTQVKSRLQKAQARLRKELLTMTAANNIEEAMIHLDRNTLDALQQASRFVWRGKPEDPEERRNITGVYLEPRGRIVGTDGRRLLIREAECFKALKEGVIVSGISEDDFSSLAEATMVLGVANVIVSARGCADLRFAIVEGTFPAYEKVIPQGEGLSLRLPRRQLVALLDEMARHLADRHPLLKDWQYVPTLELEANVSTKEIVLSTHKTLGYHPVNGASGDRSSILPDTPHWSHFASIPCAVLTHDKTGAEVRRVVVNYEYLRSCVVGLGEPPQGDAIVKMFGEMQPITLQRADGSGDRALCMLIKP